MKQRSTSVDGPYHSFVSMLANMVDDYLETHALILIKTRPIDADQWIDKQIRATDRAAMSSSLTVQLLGTSHFVHVA